MEKSGKVKRLLIMIISMRLGGQEKALIDFLNELCKIERLKITLLLVEKCGEFLQRIPDKVEVKQVDIPLDIFFETTTSKRYSIPKAVRQRQLKTAFLLLRNWCKQHKLSPQEIVRNHYSAWKNRIAAESTHFDIAIDYQGQGTFPTYYIAGFVNADVKYTWIHSDLSFTQGNLEWQKELYDQYDKVFCVSKQAMENTAAVLPFVKNKVDTFYNIIPIEKIKHQALDPCEKLEGECKILTIGRLSQQKGYIKAFRAISKLNNTGFDVNYYVVGEGEQRGELEKLIKELGMSEKIHLLGYQSNPYKYLKQCDIYFQPSEFEGFCITLGEAKLFYKPIVTTDFAGAREQIEDKVTGTIIPYDENEMYYALSKMIKDPAIQKTYSDALRKLNMHSSNDIQKLFINP